MFHSFARRNVWFVMVSLTARKYISLRSISPCFPRDRSLQPQSHPFPHRLLPCRCTRPIINHDVRRGPLTTARARVQCDLWARVKTRTYVYTCTCAIIPLVQWWRDTSVPVGPIRTHIRQGSGGDREGMARDESASLTGY